MPCLTQQILPRKAAEQRFVLSEPQGISGTGCVQAACLPAEPVTYPNARPQPEQSEALHAWSCSSRVSFKFLGDGTTEVSRFNAVFSNPV